jgi:hypothetical protein
VLGGLADATGRETVLVEAELVQICVLAALRLQYRGRRALNASRFA